MMMTFYNALINIIIYIYAALELILFEHNMI